MDVTPLVKAGQQIIQSYAGGRFRVSGAVYDGPVIVTPEQSRIWDVAVQSVTELSADDFSEIAEAEVILLGSGAEMQLLPPDLRAALKQAGLVVEAMNTGAACRTYNVLMTEGRKVAAALLPNA